MTGLGMDDVDTMSMSMKDLTVGNATTTTTTTTINMPRKVNYKHTYSNKQFYSLLFSFLQRQWLKIHLLLQLLFVLHLNSCLVLL